MRLGGSTPGLSVSFRRVGFRSLIQHFPQVPLAQTLLYLLKLRRRNDCTIPLRQDACSFLVQALQSFRQGWKWAENLRDVLAFLSLWPDAGEEEGVGLRIVTSLIEILQPKVVRGRLGVAAVFEISQRNDEVKVLIHGIARYAIGDENHRGDGCQLH